MQELVVQFDDREKYPLVFPRLFRRFAGASTTVYNVRCRRQRMNTGDYCLAGHESRILIERKASIMELTDNLFGSARKRNNFQDALRRMADACAHPFLFLDMRWSDIYGRNITDENGRTVQVPQAPYAVLDTLFGRAHAAGVTVIGPQACRTPGTRRHAGDYLLRFMLSYCQPSVPRHSEPGVVYVQSEKSVARAAGPR